MDNNKFVFTDALGQLTGMPREHVQGIADLGRFRPGSRHFSPVTYWWADFYSGTSSKWAKILRSADALGFTIINVSSGAGTERQQDWVTQAAQAKAAGSRVLGYVRTTFGKRPQDEVLAEIEKHVNWYGVDGVFLDESVNGWGDQSHLVAYYRELTPKIRASHGDTFTIVSNPGSNCVEEMLDTADVLMTFESSAATYLDPKSTITPEFYRRYPSSKFWHVIHDVTRENYRAVMDKVTEMHASHIFLTDRKFVASNDPQNPAQNPYDQPPSDWLIDIQAAFSRGDLSTFERVLDLESRPSGGGVDIAGLDKDSDGNLILPV